MFGGGVLGLVILNLVFTFDVSNISSGATWAG